MTSSDKNSAYSSQNEIVKAEKALIAGTGVGEIVALGQSTTVAIPTPFGLVYARLTVIEGCSVAIISRHGAGHSVPPHKISYRAFALAAKRLSVTHCLSTAAVGSLNKAWAPGSLLRCTDYIDISFRNQTLFERSVVHTPMSEFAGSGKPLLLQAAQSLGQNLPGCVYAATQGPRYETEADIQAIGRLGAEVVGMTAASEAIAFREAGIPYECLAIVSNLAAGLSTTPLDHGDVSQKVKESLPAVSQILKAALAITNNQDHA